MRKYYLLPLFIFWAIFCFAQIPVDLTMWQNVRSSGATPEGNYHVRLETLTLPLFPIILQYYTANGVQQQEMQSLNNLTYESLVPQWPNHTQSLCIKTGTSLISYLMPFYIEQDHFPLTSSEWSEVAIDSVNEVNVTDSPNLDIEKQYFSLSENELYGAIKNVGGAFPTSAGIFGPYYAYVYGFMNPEAITDTTFYAMVYANVPLFLSSGLYRMHGVSFDSIERIGDIQTNISGNLLSFKADLSTLVNDELFGDWPNLSHSIVALPLTISFSVTDQQFAIKDYGVPGVLKLEHFLLYANNTLPTLCNSSISSIADTRVISTYYQDAEQQFPLIAEAIINGQSYPMIPVNSDFSDTVRYSAVINSNDWQSAELRFSDDSLHIVTQIVNNTANNDATVEKPCLWTVYPQPFYPSNAVLSIQPLHYDNKNNNNTANLSIFNIKGQRIFSIQNNLTKDASFRWDGKDSKGEKVTSGIYFLKIQQAKNTTFKRIVVIK